MKARRRGQDSHANVETNRGNGISFPLFDLIEGPSFHPSFRSSKPKDLSLVLENQKYLSWENNKSKTQWANGSQKFKQMMELEPTILGLQALTQYHHVVHQASYLNRRQNLQKL